MEKDNLREKKTVRIVFISLLLDLLAFTMILPLLPALLDYYKQLDDGKGLYSAILRQVQGLRIFLDAPDRFNSVLFGGELFSHLYLRL